MGSSVTLIGVEMALGLRRGRASSGMGAKGERRLVLLVALAALALVAYRASVAVSFYDDSHYVTMALRIANGALPFADEMSVQSLGFLVPAAFAWVWTRLVGMTGLVLAYRMLYVVLAAGVSAFVYRVLRVSHRPLVAAPAALLPLICPPFNLIAPSYNTMAMLGLAVAFAAGYSALSGGPKRMPYIAGAAMAFAAISYLPLSVAVLAFFATLLFLGRGKRLALPVVLGGVAMLAALVAWLVPLVGPGDIQRALAFATSNVSGFASPLEKLGRDGSYILRAIALPQAWPILGLAILASLPKLPRTARACALLALPLAASVPGVWWLTQDTLRLWFGTTAPAWLLAFVATSFVPLALWARREGRRDISRALQLAAPASIIGVLVVAYSTNASLARAVPVVGMVPLSIVIVLAWTTAVGSLGGFEMLRAGALVLLSCVLVLLFTASLDDARPSTLHASINSGAYAGMHMSALRYREMTGLAEAAEHYVTPGDHVTFLGERTGYLLVGGKPYTNAVWLYPGPADYATIEYFRRHGGLPEVVFVDERTWTKKHQHAYAASKVPDPMLSEVLAEYRMVDSAADFDIFVRRSPRP